jgi:hypothetical protein
MQFRWALIWDNSFIEEFIELDGATFHVQNEDHSYNPIRYFISLRLEESLMKSVFYSPA